MATSNSLNQSQSQSQSQSGASKIAVILAVAVAALLGSGILLLGSYNRQRAQESILAAKEAELAALRLQSVDLDRLATLNQQVQILKQDNNELVQLRGEIAALRPLKAQLDSLKSLELENQQLKAQVRQLQSDLQQNTSLRNQNQQLQDIITQRMQITQTQTCVANLRSIEAAKTAWAADFQKREVDIPVDTDLFGPEAYVPTKPVCPNQGTYTLGPVQQAPSCSIPAHAY